MTDYINRESAIVEIKRFIGYLDEDMVERLRIAINRIPAADVRPVVRSRWIEIDDYVLCANCGTAEHGPNRNFCHDCGADMRQRGDGA